MLKREVLNKSLILILLEHLKECVNGLLKLQAIIYQVQKNMRNKGITRTFNYKFIRWHYGPYSKELSDDIKFLKEKQLIQSDYSLSEDGERLVNSLEKIIKKMYQFDDEAFYRTGKNLNELDIKTLLIQVYEDNKIIDCPMGKVIQSVLYDETSKY